MIDKLKEAIEVLKMNRPLIGRIGDEAMEAIDTVVSAVENPTYTPADMDSFAGWCSVNGWEYQMFEGEWWNERDEIKTTAQLREMWEVETGRKEETE